MRDNNLTNVEAQKGSARVPRAGERLLAIANFVFALPFRVGAQHARRVRYLLARRSDRLRLCTRRFQAEDCFAFLHQIKPIARDRFQVAHISLEQTDFARLFCEQSLLLVDQLLKIIDLGPALH